MSTDACDGCTAASANVGQRHDPTLPISSLALLFLAGEMWSEGWAGFVSPHSRAVRAGSGWLRGGVR